MSFLYEPKLLNKLNDIVFKTSQAQVESHGTLANKLILNLDNEFNSPNDKVTSDNRMELAYDNLLSLNAFLKHLYDNAITIMNHTIVHDGDSDSAEVVSGETAQVKVDGKDKYVHKEALTAYLNRLATSATKNKNKRFGQAINKLMQEARQIFGKQNFNLAEVYYDDEVHSGLHLVDVHKVNFSPDERGVTKITLGDLSDKTSFNKWLQSNFKNIEDVYNNLASGLKYLYNVLSMKANRATTKFWKNVFDDSVKNTSNVAKSYNVNIDSPTTTTTNKPVEVGEMTAQELGRVMSKINSNLPFGKTDISIDRINHFFNEISKLDSNYSRFKSGIIDNLNKASLLTTNNLKSFPVNSTYQQMLSGIVKENRNYNGFAIYINALISALESLYNVVNHFRSQQKSRLSKDVLRNLDGQIGKSSSSSSIYRTNVYDLMDAKKRAQRSIKSTVS